MKSPTLKILGTTIPSIGNKWSINDIYAIFSDTFDSDVISATPAMFINGGRWFGVKSFWEYDCAEYKARGGDTYLTPHGCLLFARFMSWHIEDVVLQAFIESGVIDGSFVGR